MKAERVPRPFLPWIGRACRQAREERGVHQVEIAAALKVNQATIARFEDGTAWPRRPEEVLMAYASELGDGRAGAVATRLRACGSRTSRSSTSGRRRTSGRRSGAWRRRKGLDSGSHFAQEAIELVVELAWVGLLARPEGTLERGRGRDRALPGLLAEDLEDFLVRCDFAHGLHVGTGSDLKNTARVCGESSGGSRDQRSRWRDPPLGALTRPEPGERVQHPVRAIRPRDESGASARRSPGR